MKKLYVNLKFSIEWIILMAVSLIFSILIFFISSSKMGFDGLLALIIVLSLFAILEIVVLLLDCFHRVFLSDNYLNYKTILGQKTINLNSALEVKILKKCVYDTIFTRVPSLNEYVLISDGVKKIYLPIQAYIDLSLNLTQEL